LATADKDRLGMFSAQTDFHAHQAACFDDCCLGFTLLETKKKNGVQYLSRYDCMLGGDNCLPFQKVCDALPPWSKRVPPALLSFFSGYTTVTGFSDGVNDIVVGYLGCICYDVLYRVTDPDFAAPLQLCKVNDPDFCEPFLRKPLVLSKKQRARRAAALRYKASRLRIKRAFAHDQSVRAAAKRERRKIAKIATRQFRESLLLRTVYPPTAKVFPPLALRRPREFRTSHTPVVTSVATVSPDKNNFDFRYPRVVLPLATEYRNEYKRYASSFKREARRHHFIRINSKHWYGSPKVGRRAYRKEHSLWVARQRLSCVPGLLPRVVQPSVSLPSAVVSSPPPDSDSSQPGPPDPDSSNSNPPVIADVASDSEFLGDDFSDVSSTGLPELCDSTDEEDDDCPQLCDSSDEEDEDCSHNSRDSSDNGAFAVFGNCNGVGGNVHETNAPVERSYAVVLMFHPSQAILSLTGVDSDRVLVDGGATIHATPKENLCFDISPCSVSIAGVSGVAFKCLKKGKLAFLPESGSASIVLTDVHIAAEFPTTFISESAMVKKGCSILKNSSGGAVTSSTGALIFNLEEREGLYYALGKLTSPPKSTLVMKNAGLPSVPFHCNDSQAALTWLVKCDVADEIVGDVDTHSLLLAKIYSKRDVSDLLGRYHRRMSHISFKRVALAFGIKLPPDYEPPLCNACVIGQQRNVPHHNKWQIYSPSPQPRPRPSPGPAHGAGVGPPLESTESAILLNFDTFLSLWAPQPSSHGAAPHEGPCGAAHTTRTSNCT
jgi:hypothetical protein